ncbi:MAG TPA: acyltransferase family protein [Dehalococcoidia bacterium]|nr:acyltransferase family protein [Dehalococcoidia bacterium]
MERRAPDSSRLVSIDVLRGVAIVWVVLFHLWGDLEYFPGVPRVYYDQLWYQFEAGRGPWAVFTSFTDLVFRKGFQGVPLFMMISGLSLTIAAYRAGDGLRWGAFFVARFRKLLAPYWIGVALTYGVIALIAWRQAALLGAPFGDQFGHGVTISERTFLQIDGGVVFASAALVPRLLRDEWFFAPQLALWFVGLLAQYYVLFPVLFVLMRRLGVVAFLVLTFAITVGANAWAVHQYAALEFKFFLVTAWAPFRLFEFTAGMALGWLLIDPRASRTLAAVRHPLVLGAAVALGLSSMVAGDLLIGWWNVDGVLSRDPALYWQALALPLVTLGLALLALPLLVRRPSRIDVTLPVRAFVAIGLMSYAILIVNDAMRLVASQLRVEDVPDAAWWAFLVAVYVPASVALAWPLARVLGVMPKRRSAPRRESEPVPSRVLAPVPAEAAAS